MRLTPLITKYMSRHFMLAFLSVFLGLMALVYLFDGIELLRRTSSKEGVGLSDVLEMAMLKLPSMVHLILPFAVLIASLFVFWRLTKSHELIIIRSVGVSVWQFIAPLIIISLVIGVVNITLINPFAAATFSHYEKLEEKFDMGSSNPLNISGGGMWLKEIRGGTQYVIHASTVKQQDKVLEMSEMSVFETTLKDNFTRRMDAEIGLLMDGKFILTDAWVMEGGKAPVYKGMIDIPTVLSLDKIEDNFSSPETVSFWTIPSFIKFFEQTGFSPLKHKLHWYSLLFSPLFLVTMVLVAATFSLKMNERQGKVLIGVTLALGTGFALFFFSKFTYAFGAAGNIPIVLAVLAPVLIAAPLAVLVLLHYEDG